MACGKNTVMPWVSHIPLEVEVLMSLGICPLLCRLMDRTWVLASSWPLTGITCSDQSMTLTTPGWDCGLPCRLWAFGIGARIRYVQLNGHVYIIIWREYLVKGVVALYRIPANTGMNHRCEIFVLGGLGFFKKPGSYLKMSGVFRGHSKDFRRCFKHFLVPVPGSVSSNVTWSPDLSLEN